MRTFDLFSMEFLYGRTPMERITFGFRSGKSQHSICAEGLLLSAVSGCFHLDIE